MLVVIESGWREGSENVIALPEDQPGGSQLLTPATGRSDASGLQEHYTHIHKPTKIQL